MKGHVAERNLLVYRHLNTIALRYDDLGNSIGLRDMEETNRCYQKASEYRKQAFALREDIPTHVVFDDARRTIEGIEWRKLKEFPRYEISEKGKVREIHGLIDARLYRNPTSTEYYQIFDSNRVKKSRSRKKLLRGAFPEFG